MLMRWRRPRTFPGRTAGPLAALLLGAAALPAHALVITSALEAVRVHDVDYAWKTVQVQNTYTNLTPVCVYNLPSAADNEAVVRISNVTATSFDIKIQRPEDSSAVTASDVFCVVGEAQAAAQSLPDGRVFEVHQVLSTRTSGNSVPWNWGAVNTQDVSSSISGSYRLGSLPVVIGQVMSFNDNRFSTFWSMDCADRRHIPFHGGFGTSSQQICVGKQIGQINGVRNNETLGYMVIADRFSTSAGVVRNGSFGGISYEVAIGGTQSTSGMGVGNSPPYNYTLNGTFHLGTATHEAQYGGQGGFVVLYGPPPLPDSRLHLAIDEETVAGDTTRTHYTERVAYWLFRGEDHGDAPASYGDARHFVRGGLSLGPAGDAVSDPDAESPALSSAAADGDDNNGLDDEDGVIFHADFRQVTASVEVNNQTGSPVRVCAWLDIPPAGGSPDGNFDPADGQCQGTAAASATLNFTWTGLPDDQAYATYARVRISTDTANLDVNTPSSTLADGEVEDYQVSFDFRPTLASIGRVELRALAVEELLRGLDADDGAARQALCRSLGLEAEADGTELAAQLDPDGDGATALLAWETLREQGTVGFFVERRLAGETTWTPVGQDMLPGLINAPLGGDYLLVIPGLRSGQACEFRLIEVEARGARRVHGPFVLEVP